MNDPRADRELVIAHAMGDPGALAAIYDRYADRLYDTAAAMLGDRHEAADAMQDVFLTAAVKLGQLRDPDRLGPWLFAVLRHTVYRRTARRGRHRLVDPTSPGSGVGDMAATVDPRADGAQVSAEELGAMVRAAAAGLDTRDQLVLELSARQGLTGADLADALGVTPEQSHVLVHRMRERVERSLGALTVARMGRKDCTDLADVLSDWDGRFDVLVRKRVARHIERCEVCTDTKRRYAVVALLGATPALAAPPELRDLVLARVRAASGRGASAPTIEFDRRGFPTVPRNTRTFKVAAAVMVLLAIAGTTTAIVVGRDDPTVVARAGVAPTITTAAIPTAPPITAPPITAPPITAPPITTPITDAPPPATTAQPATTNTVAPPPPPAPPARPAPAAQPVPPVPPTPPATAPQATAPTTTAPPATAPQATAPTTMAPTTTLPLRPPPPSDTIPPVVTIVRAVPSISCPWTVDPTVAARVVDDSAISGVTLSWQLTRVLGRGSASMIEPAPGEWRGSLGINRTNGTWSYTVTAIDAAGNRGTASGTIVVTGC